MSEFKIVTDTACDIQGELLNEWGVEAISMSFRFENEDREYLSDDMQIEEFYEKMKNGGIAKTAAINPDTFKTVFEALLKEQTDILYLAFSSGLSTTCNSAKIAAEELKEFYPDRKIEIIDTLAASAGQGLLVYYAAQMKKEGKSLEQIARYINDNALSLCHWFTVDDLVYLKRGGRVSPAVALVGKALGIKPILHVDNEGHLIKMSTVRGRRGSIEALAEKYAMLAKKSDNSVIFISHANCREDAQLLSDIIKEKTGAETRLITNIGAVIGAHSGPGTIALFFLGNER